MRALVTGADGFAGRWLCRLLVDEGADVFGWVRQGSRDPIAGTTYRTLDIRDRIGCAEGMKLERPDLVFHLAAMTHLADCERDPGQAHETNVVGAKNVILSMPESARAVFASTCHVYGPPKMERIRESHPIAPVGVYARTKFDAECALRASGRDVVIARSFHHTGPGQSTRYVLADWASQIKSGTNEVMTGDLTIRRDFTDVRDIVEGYLVLARRGVRGEAYNLCSGSAPSLGELFSILKGQRNCQPVEDPERIRTADVNVFCGDHGRAKALGWVPRRLLADTLVGMV